jgi:ribosomal protein S18 acetylase RimI-like enzyme
VNKLRIEPLTAERFGDLEQVFAARGCSVARNCWCMYYRVSGPTKPPPGMTLGQARRADFKALVDAGVPTGILAYRDGQPVGWLSFGPREDYAKLARSPVMKPVDEQPVWSIVCFVVPSAFRGQGVAHALLRGAIAFARERGIKLLEAYPVDKPARTDDENMWFGAKSMFDAAGFEEVARRKPERPVVRLKPV